MFNAIKKATKSLFNYDYNPNILIADAASAIHNGFMKGFDFKSLDDFYRVMCWSYVDGNCEDNLKSYPSEIREEIIQDIKDIQVMPSRKAFKCAVDMFLNHFKNEWIDKNNGWYEGFIPSIRSIDYKDVPIERKPKRGRKAKAKEALLRNHD